MKTKITPFGKLLRQLRIEGEIHMKDMAKALNVSIAQLSALETGKRKITDDYVSEVIKYFAMLKLDTSNIQKTADQSRDAITINLSRSDATSKELISSFARRLPSLSEEDKVKFAKLLNHEEAD